MILKNKKGIEREFKILFEITKNDQKYIVYEDILSGNIYAGKLENNFMKVLNDQEYNYVKKVIEKF